jgi:glycosyltransferase involved in cell wall biosynthesis
MNKDHTSVQADSFKSMRVSVVIIGRNEGARLTRCIESVQAADWQGQAFELIYVDSSSTDDSVLRAWALGAQALVLDDASPCAAKARNLGWRVANAPFVLFLDGDTCLHPAFVQKALAALNDPVLCAAWGHRRESHPHQSIYNRVMDLDWIYPVGRTLYFGGDVLVRRSALVAVDGYDPSLKAGEEPEMCARLRAEGWEIEHMDVPMTQHDLAITTFKAYWWRAFRSGIAYAEVAERMRLRGDPMWQHDAKRDFRHGLLFTLTPVFMWIHPWVTVAVLVAAGGVLGRTAKRCAWKAPGQSLLCWQYAVHVMFQKIPAFFGQLSWRRAQRQNKEIRMVDYKQADAPHERS